MTPLTPQQALDHALRMIAQGDPGADSVLRQLTEFVTQGGDHVSGMNIALALRHHGHALHARHVLARWAELVTGGDIAAAFRALLAHAPTDPQVTYAVFSGAATLAAEFADLDTAIALFTAATRAPCDGDDGATVLNSYQEMAGDYDDRSGHASTAQAFVTASASVALPPRARILDVCCGTGLVGAAFRDRAGRLEGIDLSPRMAAASRARGCYDAVWEGDAIAAMAERQGGQWDLVTCCFAAYHWRDATPLYRQAGRLLALGGRFVVSEFPCSDQFDVRQTIAGTKRMCRSRRHVTDLARQSGMVVDHYRPMLVANLLHLVWVLRRP